MTAAKLTGIAPQLVVADVVRSAKFYRDVFGFSTINYFGDPPAYAMVNRDGFEVHFGRADGGDVNKNREIRAATPDFLIWVSGIEDYYEELRANGAAFVQQIVQRSYGREFIAIDCDGHQMMVVE